jgi:hypothetical protein
MVAAYKYSDFDQALRGLNERLLVVSYKFSAMSEMFQAKQLIDEA